MTGVPNMTRQQHRQEAQRLLMLAEHQVLQWRDAPPESHLEALARDTVMFALSQAQVQATLALTAPDTA